MYYSLLCTLGIHQVQIEVCVSHILVRDDPQKADAAGQDREQDQRNKAEFNVEQALFVALHDADAGAQDFTGAAGREVQQQEENLAEQQGYIHIDYHAHDDDHVDPQQGAKICQIQKVQGQFQGLHIKEGEQRGHQREKQGFLKLIAEAVNQICQTVRPAADNVQAVETNAHLGHTQNSREKEADSLGDQIGWHGA